jgi:hypothetical protein
LGGVGDSSKGLNADLDLYDSGGRTRIGSSRLRAKFAAGRTAEW